MYKDNKNWIPALQNVLQITVEYTDHKMTALFAGSLNHFVD